MSVASVSTITAASPYGFQDTVFPDVNLASITSIEIVSERARVENGNITEYVVELKIIFVLEG